MTKRTTTPLPTPAPAPGSAVEPVDKNGKPLRGAALARTTGQIKGGRKKGTPNKIRAEVADMVREALDQAGGVAYLVRCAKKNPNAFLALAAKLMPTKISGDINVNTDLAARLAEAEARAKHAKEK